MATSARPVAPSKRRGRDRADGASEGRPVEGVGARLELRRALLGLAGRRVIISALRGRGGRRRLGEPLLVLGSRLRNTGNTLARRRKASARIRRCARPRGTVRGAFYWKEKFYGRRAARGPPASRLNIPGRRCMGSGQTRSKANYKH